MSFLQKQSSSPKSQIDFKLIRSRKNQLSVEIQNLQTNKLKDRNQNTRQNIIQKSLNLSDHLSKTQTITSHTSLNDIKRMMQKDIKQKQQTPSALRESQQKIFEQKVQNIYKRLNQTEIVSSPKNFNNQQETVQNTQISKNNFFDEVFSNNDDILLKNTTARAVQDITDRDLRQSTDRITYFDRLSNLVRSDSKSYQRTSRVQTELREFPEKQQSDDIQRMEQTQKSLRMELRQLYETEQIKVKRATSPLNRTLNTQETFYDASNQVQNTQESSSFNNEMRQSRILLKNKAVDAQSQIAWFNHEWNKIERDHKQFLLNNPQEPLPKPNSEELPQYSLYNFDPQLVGLKKNYHPLSYKERDIHQARLLHQGIETQQRFYRNEITQSEEPFSASRLHKKSHNYKVDEIAQNYQKSFY